MSIFKASRCLLPLIKRAGSNRIIQRPFIIKYQHFRFLTTTPTLKVTETPTVTNAEADITTVLAESMEQKDTEEEEEEPKHMNSAEIEDAWQVYLERSKNEQVPPSEIYLLGREIKFAGGEQAITRIQTLLRDLNSRRSHRAYQEVFDKLCGMLIYLFGTMGDIESAHIVFNGLVASSRYVRAATIYTVMDVIRSNGTKKQLSDFCKTLEERNLMPSTATGYTRLMYAFNSFNDLYSTRHYFSKMLKKGLATDEKAYKLMMYAYKNADQPWGILETYDLMKKNNVKPSLSTFTIVLTSLKDKGKRDKNFERVATDLRNSGITFNGWTYLLLEASPKEALDGMNKAGTSPTILDYNAFLTYHIKKNQITEALEIYNIFKKDENVTLDRFSYSILMDLLVKASGHSHQAAFDLYEEMKEKGITPDQHTYSTLLFGCNQTLDLNRAVIYFQEMEDYGIKPNVYTYNGMLGVISVVDMPNSNRWDIVRHTWDKMISSNLRPDIRSYNHYLTIMTRMIQPVQTDSIASDQGVEDSLLWPKPEQEVSKPVREILETYRHMKMAKSELDIAPDFVTYTIVIAALCKAGQLRPALKVYDDTKMTNYKLPPTTYNHIMASLERAGKPSEVMNVWHDMRIHNVLPDSKGYEIVLDVCDQMGLVDSLSMIREQRKMDVDRLLKLEQERDMRMNKAH